LPFEPRASRPPRGTWCRTNPEGYEHN